MKSRLDAELGGWWGAHRLELQSVLKATAVQRPSYKGHSE